MIVVTAATGQLGRLAIEALLRRVPPSSLAAAARAPGKAADLAARGIEVRQADYSRPETLASAFKPGDAVLFISSSELGQRAEQHAAVVEAAKAAGVARLVYTSLLRADTSPLPIAGEHLATEQAIRASGVPFTLLRNGWYFENHTAHLAGAIERGVIAGAAGNGRFASASRADYAEAAAAVVSGSGHDGAVYELAGAPSFTLAELAGKVSRLARKTVSYLDLPPSELRAALVAAGLPPAFADVIVECDLCAARGALEGSGDDLRKLLGRPSTTLADAVAAGLRHETTR